MKNRVYFIDFLRAICIVWIVGFWHILDYLPETSDYVMTVRSYGGVTLVVLSIFTFLSGLFMGRYSIRNKNDVLYFYKKRLSRFYILLVLSCLTLYFIPHLGAPYFKDLKALVLSVIGLSSFYSPPLTLWYIEMLVIFYLLTPLILLFHNKKRIIVGVIILLLFMILRKYGCCDSRIIVYFPFYFVGLFCGIDRVCYLWRYIGTSRIIAPFKIILCNNVVRFLVSCLAYSSMSAYLFHRQLYSLLLYCNISLGICVPLILFLSFYIQKIYDFICVEILK